MASQGGIKIGLFLTNQHTPGADLVSALEEQLRMVRAARDCGWDSVWAGQHYLPDGMAMPQCVPFVSRITAESGHMDVGIGILLLALHNPLDVAETWASIDVLCGGRLTSESASATAKSSMRRSDSTPDRRSGASRPT